MATMIKIVIKMVAMVATVEMNAISAMNKILQ
jgi:hypothetical protein